MKGSVNVPGVSGPELKAVQNIANAAMDTAASALAKANEALEGGGSSGCVIKITFDAGFVGQPYTVTDGSGDTKTGTVPESLVDSVSVENCNTEYIISATANNGVEYSSSITTGPYYGQYTATLSVFTATINATAVAGAVVTAECDGDTYQATAGSNGVASISVKKAGTYTVKATYDGATSNSASVNVTTSGSTYTATVKFITLTVTIDSGSTVTAKNGTTTLSKASTGTAKFYLPNTGTWTVTATKDGETATGSVSATAYQAYSLTLAYVKIYGVTWDKTSKTTLTRTDDALGFTDPVPSVNGSAGSSPFDNCLPWSGMVKETDATGGVLVKIPKFWYKWESTTSTLTLRIADKAVSGYHVSPAHADRGDGKGERDYVYIGRYKCNSSYKSATGAAPVTGITRATARTGIHNLGSTFYQQDFAMFWTTRMLYLVEYANWDGQAAIGYNCGNGSSKVNTGTTDSMTYHTGTTAASKTTYGTGVQYRWIEDPWGNVLEWCDGIYFSSANVYVINNPANFSDTTGGTLVGTRPTSIGYISGWNIPTVSGLEWALYPNAVAGSETTYVADYCYCNSTGVVLCVGGYYSQYRYYGPFYLDGYFTASYTYAYIGARLQKLP